MVTRLPPSGTAIHAMHEAMHEHSACCALESPIGPLTLVASDAGLRHVHFGASLPQEAVHEPAHPVLARAAQQLAAYFAGDRTTFDLSLDLVGTPFQQAVWALLQAIPYGETTTYGELAKKMGDPGTARAVGLANAKNPAAIVVPCHRVIGASGALTGFAGGLKRKAFLLQLERTHRPPRRAAGQQADLFGA